MAWWTIITQLFSLAAFSSSLADQLAGTAVGAGVGCLNWAYSSVDSLFGVDEKLEQLSRTADRIRALLKDAEETRFIEDAAVLRWLADLKDFAFDVDDLVDEFQTFLEVSKRKRDWVADGSLKRLRPWEALPSRPIWLRSRGISKKIKEIKCRYNEIKQSRDDLHLRDGESKRRERAEIGRVHQAGLLQDNSSILGFDGQKNEILTLLQQDPSQIGDSSDSSSSETKEGAVPVVAIVGAGGTGKTTLARLVVNDEQWKDPSSLMIWICVKQDYGVERITHEIIKEITQENCDNLGLVSLQRQLQQLVVRKKFLLVLDGLWSADLSFWETLRAPLMTAEKGSRVLVTCQNKLILTCIRPLSVKFMDSLGEDASWLLFCRYAFQHGAQSAHGRFRNLEHIGSEIVGKCRGSPLALISIGSLLYNTTREEEWKNVLNDIPDTEDHAHDILWTLKVSYDSLPLHLKQCFAFCSIFPNGYEFDREELVKLWIALGLVKGKGERSPKYFGYRYFDCLLWRSFFQSSDGFGNQKEIYKMPGLVHELSQFVSAHECLRINNAASLDESKNARYALSSDFSMNFQDFQKMYQNKKLRAFVLLGKNGNPTTQIPDNLYQNLECLRVLDLRKNELVALPDSISKLVHLRYLNVSGTKIERLPESFCNLHNLEFLELDDCEKLVELPEAMGYLIKLQYLGLHLDWEHYRHKWTDIIAMPPGLGRLTSLQTLSRFSVSKRGCKLRELKDMKLQGELCISKLENVVDVKDVEGAKLTAKENIDSMMLRWTSCDEIPILQYGCGEDVIKHLRPHRNLKHLWVENYGGAVFPSWLGDHSFNLQTLRLYGCKRCTNLPRLGRLKNLKCLYIEGLHEIKQMGSLSGNGHFVGFPSLEMFSISKMDNLEKGFELVLGEMPSLRKIIISECYKLKELPQLPNSLEDIKIRKCPALRSIPELPSLRHLVLEECNLEIIQLIYRFRSLFSLTICQFPELRSISQEILIDLNSLKALKIKQCAKLTSLASQHLSALDSLEVSSCPEFSSFVGRLSASLKEFRVLFCDKLTSLPEGLHLLPSLRYMEIQAVQSITSLPTEGVPDSLQYLAISECPSLEQRCQRGGRDWHKIQRILNRKIGESSTL